MSKLMQPLDIEKFYVDDIELYGDTEEEKQFSKQLILEDIKNREEQKKRIRKYQF